VKTVYGTHGEMSLQTVNVQTLEPWSLNVLVTRLPLKATRLGVLPMAFMIWAATSPNGFLIGFKKTTISVPQTVILKGLKLGFFKIQQGSLLRRQLRVVEIMQQGQETSKLSFVFQNPLTRQAMGLGFDVPVHYCPKN